MLDFSPVREKQLSLYDLGAELSRVDLHNLTVEMLPKFRQQLTVIIPAKITAEISAKI